MPPKLKNRLTSGLWILLPLILLLLISNRIAEPPLTVSEGRYEFLVNGIALDEITGNVAFEESEIISKNGHLLNVLKINFEDTAINEGMNMEFLISLRSDAEPIAEGKYYVNRYISGFVSEFNGVFGYANLYSHGEEPYFSKSGHVNITAKSDDIVQGTMKVTLEDVAGKKLHLQGSFKALRQ